MRTDVYVADDDLGSKETNGATPGSHLSALEQKRVDKQAETIDFMDRLWNGTLRR
jgi:hypothetical protein